MPTIVSSYIPTLAGAVDTRVRDSLPWTLAARPQAMSIYVRFQETGAIRIGGRLLQIGALASDTVPRLIILPTNGFYLALFETASVQRTSTLASAPAIGQIVELLLTLSASGVVQISQSIAGGAISAATAGAATILPPAWSGTALTFNSSGVAGDDGTAAFLNVLVVRGVQDMTAMRRIAGVV